MNAFIKHKLNDERGATILMALFAFMVAAMVCIVILGAATSSVRQAKQDQQHQQDMLLLESAAELIQSEVGKTSASFTDTTTYTYANKTATQASSSSTSRSFDEGSKTLVSQALLEAVETLNPADSSAQGTPAPKTFTISVAANSDSDDSFNQDVTVKFSYLTEDQVSVSGKNWRFALSTKADGEKGSHTLYIDYSASSVSGNPVPEKDRYNRETSSSVTTTYAWTQPYCSSTEEGLKEGTVTP